MAAPLALAEFFFGLLISFGLFQVSAKLRKTNYWLGCLSSVFWCLSIVAWFGSFLVLSTGR
jgi:hypothetical protein